jgi:Mitochondrial K+-H+ exchange-related
MRIIALPLTTSVRGPRHTEEPSPLVYYHFQMRKTENRRRGWVDWATSKAASVWAQFGQSPESSWKVGHLRVVSDRRLWSD